MSQISKNQCINSVGNSKDSKAMLDDRIVNVIWVLSVLGIMVTGGYTSLIQNQSNNILITSMLMVFFVFVYDTYKKKIHFCKVTVAALTIFLVFFLSIISLALSNNSLLWASEKLIPITLFPLFLLIHTKERLLGVGISGILFSLIVILFYLFSHQIESYYYSHKLPQNFIGLDNPNIYAFSIVGSYFFQLNIAKKVGLEIGKIAPFVVIFINICAILLTGSAAGTVLVLMITMVFYINLMQNFKWLLVLFSFAITFVTIDITVTKKFTNMESLNQRIEMANNGFDNIKKKPWLGEGLGSMHLMNFNQVQRIEYINKYTLKKTLLFSALGACNCMPHLHNSILGFVYELGLLIFIPLVLLLIYPFIVYKLYFQSQSRSLLIIYALYVLWSFVDDLLFFSQGWIFLGLLYPICNKKHSL